MKKYKILSSLIVFVLILQPFCLASDTLYVWSDNTYETSEVNAEIGDDFLKIESESVILIEQKTRASFI